MPSFLDHEPWSQNKWKNTWPGMMAKALPDLLQHLCSNYPAPSLERMQLLDVKIDLKETSILGRDASFKNVVIKINNDVKDNLILSGDLMSKGSHVLTLTIGYFLRGERRFFREKPLDLVFVKSDITIKESDIQSFFKSIDQDNNFFYDQALTHLNGRSIPSIPSQMIISLLLGYILSLDSHAIYRNFYFVFHGAISLKRRLQIGHTNHLADKCFALFADDACAVTVQIPQ